MSISLGLSGRETDCGRGGNDWMHQAICRSTVLGDDLKKIMPVVLEGGSDFFSNGIHLNVIEAAPHPAVEASG